MRAFVLFLAFALLVAVMEAATRLGWVSELSVARPSLIAVSLAELILAGEILLLFLVTLAETLAATVIATVVGVPLGLVLFLDRDADLAFRGWIATIAAAPLALLFPLFLVLLGRNHGTLVAIGAVAAVAPIVIKTRDGLVGIRPVLLNVGRSFGAPAATTFREIMLPAAAPTIVNGLRVGLIFALVNIVAVEYLINFGGLGRLVGDMADRFDMPGVYSAILFIVLVSAMFFAATERLEKWLRPA